MTLTLDLDHDELARIARERMAAPAVLMNDYAATYDSTGKPRNTEGGEINVSTPIG